MDTNTNANIQKYYDTIVNDTPSFIDVKNSYERYCLYAALEKYANDIKTIYFNKSRKKEKRYASIDTCKYCFKIKHDTNVIEWDTYYGDDFGFHCKECNNKYAKVWEKGDEMFTEKKIYKINIYYEKPNIKTRCFVHHQSN
jgi:hypothetical protein